MMSLVSPEAQFGQRFQRGLDPVSLNNEIRTYYNVHKKSIVNWSQAIDFARDIPGEHRTPIVAPLQDVYEYVMLDRTMRGLIMNMKSLTRNQKFELVDDDGVLNEDATELLSKVWFDKWMDLTMDAYYYGWSLIQLGKLNKEGEISDVHLLERRNTLPSRRIFLRDSYNQDGPAWDINSKALSSNLCLAYTGAYSSDKFGVLESAALAVLYKFWAISYWSEHIEEFGKPKKHVETDTTNAEHVEYLKEALQGQNDTIITNVGDSVTLLTAGSSDPFQLYMNNIALHNDEISKLIQGQTGTSEIGTNYQEASTHNSILQSRGRDLMTFVERVFNAELLPKLIDMGYDIGDSLVGKFNVQYQKSTKEQLDTIDILTKSSYRVSPEWIEKNLGIPVEDKFEEQSNMANTDKNTRTVSRRNTQRDE